MGGDSVFTPTLVCDDVEKVSCSGCLTVIQKKNGEVLCYGYNPYGQCGVDPEHKGVTVGIETVAYLNPMTTLPPSRDIDTGLQHVISLSVSGDVYTWGKGGNGQLGDGNILHSHLPAKIQLPNICIKVAAGFAHSVAICEKGIVYIWGKGCSDSKFSEEEQGLMQLYDV